MKNLHSHYLDVFEVINRSVFPVIITHNNPDLDTLGSGLALYMYYKSSGKKISILNFTSIPHNYYFLPFCDNIRSTMPLQYDCIIIVDTAVPKLISLDLVNIDVPIITFDHHMTHSHYGTYTLLDTTVCATACIVFDFFMANSIKISSAMATVLYAALLDDSGFFSYERVTISTFEMAMYLLNRGANATLIAQHTKQVSLAKLRLKGIALSSFILLCNGSIAYTVLDENDFVHTGAEFSDSDGLAEELLCLPSVQIAIMVRYDGRGFWKGSIRSKNINVLPLASQWEGGGHQLAAGFHLSNLMTKEDVIYKITMTFNTFNF